MLGDYLTSLIRTAVPVAVGALLTWAARNFGIVLDEHTSAELTNVAVAVAAAGYYALVRGLETRWPWFGKLLGRQTTPRYLSR